MKEIKLEKLNDNQLKVSEIFSSIEGEGIRAGYIATFIRLIGCNLRCSYCDSMYAVEPKGTDYRILTIEEIVNTCKAIGNYRVTLTGGEPLLNQEKSMKLIDKLLENEFSINIETNGAIDLQDYYKRYIHDDVLFTIDYKGKSSGQNKFNIITNYFPVMNPYFKHMDFYKERELEILNNTIVIKFVVGNLEDLQEMKEFIHKYRTDKSNDLAGIFVSPVFGKIDPETIVNFLKKEKLQEVRIQLQLHKFIWNSMKRGV